LLIHINGQVAGCERRECCGRATAQRFLSGVEGRVAMPSMRRFAGGGSGAMQMPVGAAADAEVALLNLVSAGGKSMI